MNTLDSLNDLFGKIRLHELFCIKRKVAVITGAKRGLGKTLALAFSALGAKVIAASRNIESMELIISRDIEEGCLFSVQADVTRGEDVHNLFEKAMERFGRIDILINNAGIFIPSTPEEITGRVWDEVIDTNLKGAFLCAQAAGKIMKAQCGGKIINISSVSGSRATPIPLSASYDASKGGLENLTRALAVAWARYHINVNAIAPCALETPMKIPLPEDEESRKLERIPMRRRGTPTDLIGAAVFLSSPASDFVTGHVLAVDGGRLAW
jgi:NAD(P)-dependent dehydrogenase (short-subunit alcohol dehydrogenase family)